MYQLMTFLQQIHRISHRKTYRQQVKLIVPHQSQGDCIITDGLRLEDSKLKFRLALACHRTSYKSGN